MAAIEESEAGSKKEETCWHPHVYAPPPKSPTPFSIDDILKRQQAGSSQHPNQAMDYVSEWNKLLALWAMVGGGQNAANHNSVNGSEESGRESLQSGSPLGLQICDQNDNESSPQPLNLSLTTNKPIKDRPYNTHHHEFGVKGKQMRHFFNHFQTLLTSICYYTIYFLCLFCDLECKALLNFN